MIVELFGPSAAGKTTLARALAGALQKAGCNVQLVASSRPAECTQAGNETTTVFARSSPALSAAVSRAAKFASAVPVLLPGFPRDAITTELMALLPPRGFLWSIRYRRYLSRLACAWNTANASEGIAIVDQGFLSGLCSLFLLSRSSEPKLLERGLEFIPRPNLVIRLEASRDVVEGRLLERLRRQSAAERLFELDIEMNLKQIGIVRELADILRKQGWPIMEVSCLDHRLLEKAVETVLELAKSPDTTRNGRRAAEFRSVTPNSVDSVIARATR